MRGNPNFTVGIDLGTTFSCCHYYNQQADRYEVLVQQGYNQVSTLPSIVDFTNKPVRVGSVDDIKDCNVVSEVKRLIGLRREDPAIKEEERNHYFPYELDEDDEGMVQVRISTDNFGDKKFYPEDISAMILLKFKQELAEEPIGIDIDTPIKAVVTVPAYFSNESISKTKKAAAMANFKLINLVKEPIAAAYAYKERVARNGYFLTFDLGGGTFDVSLMKKNRDKAVEVKFYDGVKHLGGIDFDNIFTDYVLKKLREVKPEIARQFTIGARDSAAIRRKKIKRRYALRKLVEKAKIELSSRDETVVKPLEVIGGDDDDDEGYITVSRSEFENENLNLFNQCNEVVSRILDTAKIHDEDIVNVLMVGGSSQIPYIKNMMKERFGVNRVLDDIDCNLVVSLGAEMYAHDSIINPDNIQKIVTDCVVRDIFIDAEKPNGEIFKQKVLEAGTALPFTNDLPIEIHGSYAEATFYEGNDRLSTERFSDIPSGYDVFNYNLSVDRSGQLTLDGQYPNGRVVHIDIQITKEERRRENRNEEENEYAEEFQNLFREYFQ